MFLTESRALRASCNVQARTYRSEYCIRSEGRSLPELSTTSMAFSSPGLKLLSKSPSLATHPLTAFTSDPCKHDPSVDPQRIPTGFRDISRFHGRLPSWCSRPSPSTASSSFN